MKDKKIVYDYSICSGCLACMVNCSQFQESHASLVSARIKIELEPFRGQYLAYFCQQCHDASCLKECPSEAIRFNQEGNYYEIDDELCTGCQACLEACPHKAIFFDPSTNKVIKCNTCQGDPMCTKSCYTGALTWRERQ
ncbi:MAG: 4Fe-4S dicluster domain-containing protein [bacterium]